MKSNPSPSAPLNLCPPTGVTGTTLDDLPDRRTVWEMRVDGYFLRWCGTLEQFRKDCEEYCDRSKGYWEKVTNTEFRFISPEEPKITHFKAVKKGVDSIAESSATLPAPPVKDTPDFSGLSSIFDKAELASRKTAASPASPVDSMGVPELLKAVLEKANETLPGKRVACQSDFRKDIQTALTRALASHAAKDAKIKALEDKFREIETICTESPADCRKRMGTRVGNVLVIARAALALPCA